MKSDAPYYRLAIRIFADFSGSIAVPAVLATVSGKWLDQKYHTHPRWLFFLLVIAFLSTAVHLRSKTKKYHAEYEKLLSKK
ncbi:MAG: AtpZ/AtpI family protein [Patescibacteria group bacterium]